MKRFFKNVSKYFKYAIYQAKAELKAEITNSYLNWIWWFLDPLCNMLIYTFIVEIVFKTSEPYFPVFVFIGITTYDLFSRIITGSVKTVKNNIGLINKVYVPKYIFLLSNSFVYLFKFFIAFIIILGLMVIFHVQFTWQILNFPLIVLTIYTVAFGIGTILLHFGVFVEDLSNVTSILLKFVYYFSGIFYSIPKRIPKPYATILLIVNPAAFCIHQFRKIFIDGVMPNYLGLLMWFIAGIILMSIGISLIHKYEDNYAKVA